MFSTDHFIPFTSDYGFKVTFGNQENTLFLCRAIQALIGIPIEYITFDPTVFEGITIDSRAGVYDLACRDSEGNTFIVEMQVALFKDFIQRLKFYGFQKFNTLVHKGNFDYANLPKIYCIAILSENKTEPNGYHNISSLKNQDGAVVDEQMSFVTVELEKFDLSQEQCTTDLEKLLYTMKVMSRIPGTIQYPDFWTEEWLRIAIDELDKRKLTPDERFVYEMTLARNAAEMHRERDALKDAKDEGVEIGIEKGINIAEAKALAEKIMAIRKLIALNMSNDSIAEILNTDIDFVEKVRNGAD